MTSSGVTSSGGIALAPLAFSGTGGQTSPDIRQAAPGPFWSRLFRPYVPKPLPPLPAVQNVNATGSFSLAPLAFIAQAGQSAPDIPQALPGPSWFRRFKPWVQKPVPPVPSRDQVSISGSFALAPLAFSGAGGQTAPDITQIQPGSTWLDLFKPWVQRLRPVPPAVQNVNCAGSFSLAPLAFAANAGQTAPDLPQAQPGPFWQRLFRPYVPKPVPPLPARDQVSTSGSFTLAPLAFSARGGVTSPDLPLQPGPAWIRFFKPWVAKPVPFLPDPTVPASQPTATGSFTLAPLAFSAAAGETSPDLPQAAPGPFWNRLFKPWIPKPLPPVPSRDQVSASGNLTLAPLAFSGSGAQTSPDTTRIQPGPLWSRLFKPYIPKPLPPLPVVQAVNGTGSLSLAPIAFAAQGGQTAPDIQSALPGPFWQRLFRPYAPKPLPPLPAFQSVNASGSFTLAPLAFVSQGGQSAPDIPSAQPGPLWQRLFRPYAPRPLPPQPAQNQISASGSFTLAPLAFALQGGATSPDQPAIQPGSTWYDLFKPWVARPKPFLPTAPLTGIVATGSFALAPLAFSGQAGQTSPDLPQIQPGPMWVRLLRPWINRPLPPVPSRNQVSASGSFALAPLAFSAQAGQTSPDIPSVQPGPFWSRLFRPYVPKPLPPLPGRDQVSVTGSLAFAPLAFSGQGAQTSPDTPSVYPGPAWLRLFKPWVTRPVPPIASAPPPLGPTATGSIALAPLAFSATGGQTSPDITQIQPGPSWLRRFKTGLNKPFPPVPVIQSINATGSIALAPLAFAAAGAQTSPDQPAIQPGPFWGRLFKPWVPKPLPPLPARDQVSASGSLVLAPLAFSASAGQTSPDIPQARPGPYWLRLFKPWITRPVPPMPAVGPIAASGGITLAPLGFAATAGQTSPDIRQILPGPTWLKLRLPWRKQLPWIPATPATNIPCSGSLALAPLAFKGQSISVAPQFKLGVPGFRWVTGGLKKNWRIP